MSNWPRSLLLAVLVASHWGAIAVAADWVVHASRAEPDRAPVGQSRFDDLFLVADGQYRIPYPFDKMLAQLESIVDNGAQSGVRQVLIPLGRSLQRDAAAPDFFRYPRVVAALQGEPRAGIDGPQGVLEYRLFIAHQPASRSLEVISYNDAAGRFEFQVVDDYDSDGQPRVRQANRSLCLGCHQNAGPIFATRPWNETSFDFEIAERLAAARPDHYDSLLDALSSDADALDLLSDRANYLAAAQLIWQRGCDGAACRAAALRSLLQYRLSGQSGFDREHTVYRDGYLDELRRNWELNWPRGLALASSRIADRDPLLGKPMTRTEDPLTLRPPHAQWMTFDTVLADGVIFRLAGFLTQADVRQIDRYLVESASGQSQPARVLKSRCRLAHEAAHTRLLECTGDGAVAALRANIELDYDGGELRSLHLLSLRLPDDPGILQPVSGPVNLSIDGVSVELKNSGGISMRLASGERLQTLQLRWQDPGLRGEIHLELSLSSEFGLIDDALGAMLRQHRDGTASSLDGQPFRRHAILEELGRALGTAIAPTPRPVSAGATLQPTPGSSPGTEDLDQPAGDLVLLQAHCGHCHGADTRQPPGFLDSTATNERIEQCAPRILARLRAWQESADDTVAPMPPPATVAPDWHLGEHYRRLVAAIEKLVESREYSRPVDARISAYPELDACLAHG